MSQLFAVLLTKQSATPVARRAARPVCLRTRQCCQPAVGIRPSLHVFHPPCRPSQDHCRPFQVQVAERQGDKFLITTVQFHTRGFPARPSCFLQTTKQIQLQGRLQITLALGLYTFWEVGLFYRQCCSAQSTLEVPPRAETVDSTEVRDATTQWKFFRNYFQRHLLH